MNFQRLLLVLVSAILFSSPALGQIDFRGDGRVSIRGEVVDGAVWLRSCFKLSNHLTYHFTGQGGGHYGLGSARRWVDEMMRQGWHGCRVFLEADWSQVRDRETGEWETRHCEPEERRNNGRPEDCMFGAEPIDQGAWNVQALRTGGRPTDVHGVAKNAMRWFFETSQETGFVFELVAVATLKHNGVTQAQQTHVIRQVNHEGYELQNEFPRANVAISGINEVDAHSDWRDEDDPRDETPFSWTLAKANMVARRADRCKHPDGRTVIAHACPPGFEAEQWAGGPFLIDQGGGDTFAYDVGPEPGKFDLGAVHPARDPGRWRDFPTDAQAARLRRDSRGQPWGVTEYMYYVEPQDRERGLRWYRTNANGEPAGWTTDCQAIIDVALRAEAKGAAWIVVHDEKGVQTLVDWPRRETCIDRWALEHLAGSEPRPPEPPTPTPTPTAVAHITRPDVRGIRYIGIEFSGWPRVVPGVRESDAVLEEHVVELPQPFRFYAAGSFIGVDRGDVGEFDLRIACAGGPILYQRSLHKEIAAPFDSEHWQYANNITCQRLRIWLVARTTGPNEILRPGQPWSSRPHFGGRLWTAPTN